MPQQQDDWVDITQDTGPDDWQEVKEPSLLEKGLKWWDDLWINKPIVSREFVNNLTFGGAPIYNPDYWDPPSARTGSMWDVPRSFVAGAMGGLGDVISGQSTPLNLATIGAFGLGGRLARAAAEPFSMYEQASRAATTAGKALSIPVMAGGAGHAVHGAQAGDPFEAFTGIGTAAGGVLGLASPHATPGWVRDLNEPVPSGVRNVTPEPSQRIGYQRALPEPPVEAAPPPPVDLGPTPTMEDFAAPRTPNRPSEVVIQTPDMMTYWENQGYVRAPYLAKNGQPIMIPQEETGGIKGPQTPYDIPDESVNARLRQMAGIPQPEPPNEVVIRNPATEYPYYKSLGYEPTGRRNPEGYPIMAREGGPPPVIEPTSEPTPPDITNIEYPGAIPQGQVGVGGGADVTVPNDRLSQGYLTNMERGGYKPAGLTPDGLSTVFKRFISEEEGTVDHRTLWRNITGVISRRLRFQDILNADPEMAAAIEREIPASIEAIRSEESLPAADEMANRWQQSMGETASLRQRGPTVSDRLRETTQVGYREIRQAVQALDNLGFDTPTEAIVAIRQHPDWMSRWDVDPNRSSVEGQAVDTIQRYLGPRTEPTPQIPLEQEPLPPAGIEPKYEPGYTLPRQLVSRETFTSTGEQIPQLELGIQPTGGYDVNPPNRGPLYTPPTIEERMAERGQRITEYMDKAKELERAGNIEESRAARSRANYLRKEKDYSATPEPRRITKAEELVQKAHIRESQGRTEEATKYREQADKLLLEEAGQQAFEFDQRKSKLKEEFALDPEMVKESQDVAPLKGAVESLSHEYAQTTLRSLPQNGPPGLTVQELGPNFADLTYRAPNGKPIGHASLSRMSNGKMGVTSLVADKSAGGLFGKAVRIMGEEIVKRDAARPNGMYSGHTARLIQRMTEFVKGEEGFLDIGQLADAIGEGFERFKGMIGKLHPELGRLIQEEEGAKYVGDVLRATGKLPRQLLSYAKKGFDISRAVKDTSTAVISSVDVSMAGRHALPLAFTKEYRQAIPKMLRAAFSPEYAKQHLAELHQLPIFQDRFDPNTGKWQPSIAKEAGMKLMGRGEQFDLGKRKGTVWAEEGFPIPYLGKAWKYTVGQGVGASNRAAEVLLNDIRAHRLQNLFDIGRSTAMEAGQEGAARPGFLKQSFTPEEAIMLNPYKNKGLAKQLATVVNTTTGRGSIKALEPAVNFLTEFFWSPRNVMSRVQMLNPHNYTMTHPQIRKEYWKAALGMAAMWSGVLGAAKAAFGDQVSINLNPNSSDFLKARIGSIRLDPGAGFQQLIVLGSRLAGGTYRSSSTGQEHKYGAGFQARTRYEAVMDFFLNKLNPPSRYVADVGRASQYDPFPIADRTVQLAVPLALQDIANVAKERPELLPYLSLPIMGGIGTQVYSKGQTPSQIIPKKHDIIFKGGPWSQIWNDAMRKYGPS